MARPERIEYKGAFYHVMNRGRARQKVFHGDDFYENFLECVDLAHKRFALEIHAYCLMENHYHLLVRTPRGNLARAMRHINGVYTQQYNKIKRTDGPLFRGRYKSINIEASSYLLQVSRYIHRNPVNTKKPPVQKPEAYRWSSYAAYRNQASTPNWLFKDAVFSELGSGRPTASYKKFVEQGIDEETETFYAKDRWPAARGSSKFIERARSHSNFGDGDGVTRVRELLPPEKVLQTVATHYDCEVNELTLGKRGKGGKNPARWIAMDLCQDHAGLKLTELAEIFGVSNASTISATTARLKKEMESDTRLAKRHKRISRDLTPVS